jgi:hypothetical protein
MHALSMKHNFIPFSVSTYCKMSIVQPIHSRFDRQHIIYTSTMIVLYVYTSVLYTLLHLHSSQILILHLPSFMIFLKLFSFSSRFPIPFLSVLLLFYLAPLLFPCPPPPPPPLTLSSLTEGENILKLLSRIQRVR